MEHTVEWLTEEEGILTFFENETVFLVAKVFITGEEEAEFRLQHIVFPENQSEIDNIRKEIILKMTECISETFRLLWEEGFEESVLVEPQGTKIAEILDSTSVVQRVYSEYMMKCHLEPQNSTNCGPVSLELTKTEDGVICENSEKTFFCRLLTYQAEQSGENCFYLYEVEVNQKKRNEGIATACLTELFRRLSREMPATIYLQVGSYNEPAVHLYKKLGFEVSEELRYYCPEEA